MTRKTQTVLGSLAITGWVVWAFIRMIPPHAIMHGKTFHHYWIWSYAHLAYSDIFALYQSHALFNHAFPYMVTPIQYPVLMGLTMWLAALATQPLAYFAITAAFVWISALLAHYWLVRWNSRGAWAFALTPMLLVYSLLNWDVIGIFLMVLGVWLYQRKRYDTSAIVFSMAVFYKLFPIFYLPFIVVQLWSSREKRRLWRMIAIFISTSLVINLPFALTNFSNWALFFDYNATRSVLADVWNNQWIHVSSVPLVDLISLLAVLVTLVITARNVYRGGSIYQAAAMLFAVFLIVNKIFSPQYMLWLMAFAILADWPLWTMGLMSIAGIIDFVNSMTILHLTTPLISAVDADWYGAHIFPLGLLARYLTLAIAPIGGWLRWKNAREDDPPMPNLEDMGA